MKKQIGVLISSILAGVCIALGGTVYLRIKDAFPGGSLAGALLFAVGLFTICTRGYHLFTGRVCALFDNSPSYVAALLLIWVGNFIGTTALALLERATAIAGIADTARTLVEGKMGTSLLSLFLLGIVCNILIYIAVNGYAKNPHELGKYLALLFGVSVFILAGTEHSIADMYYWAVSGVLFEQPGRSLLCLLAVTLGNAVGGVIFPLGEKAYHTLTQ